MNSDKPPANQQNNPSDIILDVQYASSADGLPEEKQIEQWVLAAINGIRTKAELTIRIVDEEEGTELNEKWQKKTGPTNVLSFPMQEERLPELLGDIVICAPVVSLEAVEQSKPELAHWAHMVIHGVLHLLDYDHINDNDAKAMESLEIEKLSSLGFNNPYN